MALLNILTFPDPRLRTQAKPVAHIDDTIRKLTEDMFETMYQAKGIGLAATQINVHQQIIVMDISRERNQRRVFINPEISVIDPTPFEYKEGCLSVPDYTDLIKRPRKVSVNYLDLDNKPTEIEAGGLLSVCIQHERDHLNGKLFIDYLSQLKRDRVRKQLGRRTATQSATDPS